MLGTVLKQARQVSETANALTAEAKGRCPEEARSARSRSHRGGKEKAPRKEIPCALAAGRCMTYNSQMRLGSAALPL